MLQAFAKPRTRRSTVSSLRFTFDDGRVRQIDFTLKTGLTFARSAEDHDCMLAGMILLGPDGRTAVRFAYATPARQVAERIGALMLEENQRVPMQRR